MGVRCCHLTDTDLSAFGKSYRIGPDGRLSPDPDAADTAALLQLGSYEIVVSAAAPKAEPEAAPKAAAPRAPTKKKSTSKRSTKK